MNLMSTLFGGGSASSPVETISGASALQFHGDADTVFLDVRGPGEISTSGTVKGAIRIPLPQLGQTAKADGSGPLPAVNEGKRIICVCASGARSAAAAQQLMDLGYDEVINLRGGFGTWKQAGGPVEA